MNVQEVSTTVFPPALSDTTRFNPYAEMTISSEIDAGYVSDRRQEIKEQLKEIEKRRKSFTEPLLESKRRIDDTAKSISAPLDAIIRVLDEKLITWHKSQEQIRIEAEKKRREEEVARLEAEKRNNLQTAMVTGDEQAAAAVAEVEKNIERLENKPIEIARNTRTAKSTTYLQQRWTFEIVNADEVPREFLMIDETKLGKYATTMKDTAKVAGVRFYQEASIGGRR